jgi:hypothetical protein
MRSAIDVALAELARALRRLHVSWFLFGAQAAIVYGSTRVTEDIDVTVALGTQTARALVSCIQRAGFVLRVRDSARFVETTRVLPIVHVKSNVPVDIVLAGPGLEDLFMTRARRIERGGIRIPVVCAEDLIVMKILAGRPHDLLDIRAVLRANGKTIDVSLINTTLTQLEGALGQSDLLPVFERLWTEAKRKTKTKASAKAKAKVSSKRKTAR